MLQDRPAEPLDTGQPEQSLSGLWQWELDCTLGAQALFAPWPSELDLSSSPASAVACILELENGKRSLQPTVVLQKVQACRLPNDPGQGRVGDTEKNSLLGFEKERRGVG